MLAVENDSSYFLSKVNKCTFCIFGDTAFIGEYTLTVNLKSAVDFEISQPVLL